jgi:signal transduction histidine kinase
MARPPAKRLGIAPENIAQGEGLLHDARNLMGAVGLYCDLLLIPGVLKPEHRRYAEELRLLGTQSGALMERLSLNSPQEMREAGPGARHLPPIRPQGLEPPRPVSLRAIVEHCSGLLSRVAGGRLIEVSYGAAASMPVLVAEESVERILANLVHNSAAALESCARPESNRSTGASPAMPHRRASDALVVPVRERDAGRTARTADEIPGAIRIGVGLLVNRVGESRPWPFQRVRLAVEDSGCGMTAERLEQVLSAAGTPSPSQHGIGLRVVQELVAASHGELRIMSAPGIGTRIQIEWPIAALAGIDCAGDTRRGPGHTQPSTTLRQPPDPPASHQASLSASQPHPSRVVAEPRSKRTAESAARDARWASC